MPTKQAKSARDPRTSDVWFPALVDVHEAHARIIHKYGGEAGLLQPGAIQSALERGRWGPFEEHPPTVFERAALILRGLSQDHPYVDGNKRTAYEIADTFLRRNGWRIDATTEELISLALDVAQGRLEVPQIAAWLLEKAKDISSERAT
jgi:death on curing protein